ncbi:MAG: ABC transporter permease, partial [Planctomycetes bacterium]|nr:ABC transporter permease [Planctomycetota bacterium]
LVLGGVLGQRIALPDLDLSLRIDSDRAYFALESDRILIEPAVEAAALEAAAAIGLTVQPVLTYLANTITVSHTGTASSATSDDDSDAPVAPESGRERSIPYSTVTALDTSKAVGGAFVAPQGETIPPLAGTDILLNDWAAEDLHAAVGDEITLTYYLTGPLGERTTEKARFTLRGVVEMVGPAGDARFTPDYPGITDTKRIGDWDPPFPVDLSTIREKDDRYWERYRATPKAFISLDAGLRLWADAGERFGRLTSIRMARAADGATDNDRGLTEAAIAFERALLDRIDPAALGLRFEPVRQLALAASRGSTDFGGLFIGLSLFLIVSAIMLVTLVFRLGIERRAHEIGVMLATGFTTRTLFRLLLAEGIVLSTVGTLVGLLGAVGYAWLMLAGLRSWWSGAVGGSTLSLHATPVSLSIGFLASLIVAALSLAWSLRGLVRRTPRSLLAGAIQADAIDPARHRSRRPAVISIIALGLGATLLVLSVVGAVATVAAFFGIGASLLVAFLGGQAHWLASRASQEGAVGKRTTILRLGFRNASRHPGRSLLTSGLIASATFTIVAVGANKRSITGNLDDPNSGTGGFSLLAESSIPLQFDLNTRNGRDALNLADPAGRLDHVTSFPFRLRSGDESSCLNLYHPQKPRIVGATDAFLRRGGFTFSSTAATTEEERSNPWRLLAKPLPDGAIPAIGDFNAVMWQLHLGLGKDLIITDEAGNEARLQFVALLSGSVLQGEIVVAERDFVQLFPSLTGYGFFLINTPGGVGRDVAQYLESELAPYGFDTQSTSARLTEYLAVENTYMSTFQTLGGLGLVLGTLGLTAVLLRNVFERRSELALMRALGFTRSAIARMVLAENGLLLLWGLFAGGVSAMMAVLPHAVSSPGQIPWLSLGATLVAVLSVGMLAGVVALVPTLRAPTLGALRAE